MLGWVKATLQRPGAVLCLKEAPLPPHARPCPQAHPVAELVRRRPSDSSCTSKNIDHRDTSAETDTQMLTAASPQEGKLKPPTHASVGKWLLRTSLPGTL